MATWTIQEIWKGFIKFVSTLNAVATLWIFLLMFLTTADVLGRVLFNMPITGTPELIKVSLVGILFMQLPHAFWMKRHIRSELILMKLGPAGRALFNCLAYLLGAAVFIGIFATSWSATVTAWDILEYEGEGALRVPVYPVRTILLLGSLITAVLFVVRFMQGIYPLFGAKRKKVGA
ncbi:MAG: TRAP transporter small permease [Thermodesulfobacteriota bacterium]